MIAAAPDLSGFIENAVSNTYPRCGKFRTDAPIRVPALPQSLALAAGGLVFALPAAAETFRWSSATDPQTMDPHAVNAAPVTSFLNNIYEGLVRRNAEMAIEPSLATSWAPLEGEDGWRFTLREGVVFHDGAAFTADDVLFSYERAASEESDVRSWFAPVTEARVVDEYTIDFLTNAPNPLFPDSIANFLIMDRGWAEANEATRPARDAENAATRDAVGTGPFRLVSRDPGIETRLAPFDGWWDEAEHNVTEAIFTPIGNAATGLAALLSGEIDMISPIPLQDVAQVEGREGFQVLGGLETRVIMLGFGHDRDGAEIRRRRGGAGPTRSLWTRGVGAGRWRPQPSTSAPSTGSSCAGKSAPASQLQPAGLSG